MSTSEDTASGNENNAPPPSPGDEPPNEYTPLITSGASLADRIFEQVIQNDGERLTILTRGTEDPDEIVRNMRSVRNRLILARLLMMADDFSDTSIIDRSYSEAAAAALHPDASRQLTEGSTAYKKEEEEDQCRICQEVLQDGDTLAKLSCCHMFHRSCLEEWVKRKATCPFCMTPIEFSS